MSEEEEEGQTQQEEPKEEEEEEEPFQRKTQPDIEALLAQAREAQERLSKEAEDEGESGPGRVAESFHRLSPLNGRAANRAGPGQSVLGA